MPLSNPEFQDLVQLCRQVFDLLHRIQRGKRAPGAAVDSFNTAFLLDNPFRALLERLHHGAALAGKEGDSDVEAGFLGLRASLLDLCGTGAVMGNQCYLRAGQQPSRFKKAVRMAKEKARALDLLSPDVSTRVRLEPSPPAPSSKPSPVSPSFGAARGVENPSTTDVQASLNVEPPEEARALSEPERVLSSVSRDRFQFAGRPLRLSDSALTYLAELWQAQESNRPSQIKKNAASQKTEDRIRKALREAGATKKVLGRADEGGLILYRGRLYPDYRENPRVRGRRD